MRSGDDDRGAAAVWALALVTVLALAAFVATGFGALAVARQQAAAVADLAALAGAQTLGEPCAQAAAVARANDAELVGCRADDVDVVVVVSRPTPPVVMRVMALLGGSTPSAVRVSARAGLPVD